MSFFGKEYAFVKQENFEEFVASFGLTDGESQAFINYHPNQKVVKDGDNYKVITSREVTFKSGVPFDDSLGDRKCKTTYTFNGNTLTQVQNFEDGVEFKVERVYGDDQLVVTMTSNKFNGKATRYYKAV